MKQKLHRQLSGNKPSLAQAQPTDHKVQEESIKHLQRPGHPDDSAQQLHPAQQSVPFAREYTTLNPGRGAAAPDNLDLEPQGLTSQKIDPYSIESDPDFHDLLLDLEGDDDRTEGEDKLSQQQDMPAVEPNEKPPGLSPQALFLARQQSRTASSTAQFNLGQPSFASQSQGLGHTDTALACLEEAQRVQEYSEADHLKEILAESQAQAQAQEPVAGGFAVAQTEAAEEEYAQKALEWMKAAGFEPRHINAIMKTVVSPKLLVEVLENKVLKQGGPIDFNLNGKQLSTVCKMKNNDKIFKAMMQVKTKLTLEPGHSMGFSEKTHPKLLEIFQRFEDIKTAINSVGTFCLNLSELEGEKYLSVDDATDIVISNKKSGLAALNTAVIHGESFMDSAPSHALILKIAKDREGNRLLTKLVKLLPLLDRGLAWQQQEPNFSGGTSGDAPRR
jgi:hypothetical protein